MASYDAASTVCQALVVGLKVGGEADAGRAVEAYGVAVARIVELAVAAGRRPVIPALDCSAPWIERHAHSFLGVSDRHHVIVSAHCDADSAAGGGGGSGGGGGGSDGDGESTAGGGDSGDGSGAGGGGGGAGGGGGTAKERIAALTELYEKGLVTQDEFSAAKAKVFERLAVGSTQVGTAAGVKKGVCCASVNFDCNEGVILQIDLDRDPRHAHLHDDVAYVKARTTTYCPPRHRCPTHFEPSLLKLNGIL